MRNLLLVKAAQTKAESVLQLFSQALREAFRYRDARRGHRRRLVLTIPIRDIREFHLDQEFGRNLALSLDAGSQADVNVSPLCYARR